MAHAPEAAHRDPKVSGSVCNPVDPPDRYQDIRMGGVVGSVSREAAHPSLLLHGGYNVRYGHNPENLYHSWMVFGQIELDLSSLNACHDYLATVAASNECGITPGKAPAIQ